jgi:hypothetical protein
MNLNVILGILGGLGVYAPSVSAVATWLSSMHIAWMGPVIRGLGLLSAFFAAAPLAVPQLRGFLSLLGLATAPGARAPWNPKKVTPPADVGSLAISGPSGLSGVSGPSGPSSSTGAGVSAGVSGPS